jgi:NitT/TauT family transport system substrate-binding protein
VQQKEDGSPFKLMLQWMPQSQFAGIYVAEEKGFYEKSGVLLEILRGGPDRDGLREMKAGRIDFVQTWLSTAIEYHQKEIPVVHLAQFLNRSNATIVARASRKINKLEDLNGRKISIWEGPFRPPYQALFSKTGISPVIVPQYYSVNLFLRGGVDACSAMQYNELDMIYLAGVNRDEVTVFFLRDYGVNFPEDGLFCSREFRAQYPEISLKVAEASMRGWEYAREHPEEALDIVMDRVQAERLPTNRTHMRWMLQVVLRSIFPEENDGWTAGELSREDFEITARWLKDQGLIEAIPGYDDFRGQTRVP